MGFWNGETPDQKKERLAREKFQAESIAELEAGRIPLQARARLEEARSLGGAFFESSLTSNEHLLTRQAGYEPIGQVLGSAFYRVAFGAYYQNYSRTTGELTYLTQAQLAARHLAVDRLRQEAKILGAHGVIGVRLEVGGYDWSTHLVEFTAIGTAVRLKGAPPVERPFTSDFSGQEFWKLHQAGYIPRDIVFGICSYYVGSTWRTQAVLNNSFWGSGRSNQEISQYTQGFQSARHLAMQRLSQGIREARASGSVGMHIDMEVEDVEYEVNDRTYHDLLVQFFAVGTAVATASGHTGRPAPTTTLTFYNLKDKTNSALEMNYIK